MSRCASGNLISKQNQAARLPDSTLSGIHSNTDIYRRLQRALCPRISETSHTLESPRTRATVDVPEMDVYTHFWNAYHIYAFRSVVYIPFRRGLLRVVCSDDSGMRRPQRLRTGNAGVHALSNALKIFLSYPCLSAADAKRPRQTKTTDEDDRQTALQNLWRDVPGGSPTCTLLQGRRPLHARLHRLWHTHGDALRSQQGGDCHRPTVT